MGTLAAGLSVDNETAYPAFGAGLPIVTVAVNWPPPSTVVAIDNPVTAAGRIEIAIVLEFLLDVAVKFATTCETTIEVRTGTVKEELPVGTRIVFESKNAVALSELNRILKPLGAAELNFTCSSGLFTVPPTTDGVLRFTLDTLGAETVSVAVAICNPMVAFMVAVTSIATGTVLIVNLTED